MYFYGCDIGGSSHCIRWFCKYTEPAIKWPRFKMPKVKPIPKSRQEIKGKI